MNSRNVFQVSIIGGGLGGLTLAIQLADAGYSCVLFERGTYPSHKVCGEYISMESWNFLERIGLKLSEMNLPEIKQLHVSSVSGKLFKHDLLLGGFGISRFQLDHQLCELAKEKGVVVLEDCKVSATEFRNDQFIIKNVKGVYQAQVCIGAWGKRSNMDAFRSSTNVRGKNNYVGIKYHIKLDFPADAIEIHNFKNGYCGISKIENDTYCLCYLTAAENLKKYKGNIQKMEEAVLMKNPFLRTYFKEAHFLFKAPLVISQIKIGYKAVIENQLLMLGDAAGNIAPLTGNGMSIAMRSSFELYQLIDQYFRKVHTREQLTDVYQQFWKKQFKRRIFISKIIQWLLKSSILTTTAILFLKRFSFFRNALIKSTHGNPF